MLLPLSVLVIFAQLAIGKPQNGPHSECDAGQTCVQLEDCECSSSLPDIDLSQAAKRTVIDLECTRSSLCSIGVITPLFFSFP